MLLINDENPEENWAEVLALWSRIANWTHYKPSERTLRSEMKLFLIALWNEKDWLKEQYPAKASEIEKFINKSKYLPIVGDLANTAKHRRLTHRKRSTAIQTKYYGRVVVTTLPLVECTTSVLGTVATLKSWKSSAVDSMNWKSSALS